MDTATMWLLPLALAVGLWWLARATSKRVAGQDADVRRTFTCHKARSPWVRRKSGKPAGEPADATDESADILQVEAADDFRVPKKPYDQRQPKD
jgi:hypothetical protein